MNEPKAITARAGTDGVPEALCANGRWLDVLEVLDCYCTDDRWWTGQPVSRTYYELLLEDGRTITVFRDKIKDSWHEQRYG